MSTFQVVAAEVAGHLEAKGDRPELDIHHYTLAQNGTESFAFRFARPSTALPTPGSVLEGDLGEQDRRDPERRKFMPTRSGGFGGGGPRPRDPKETAAIQRQHSQEQAIRTGELAAKLGIFPEVKSVKALADILVTLTDFWVKDIDGPTAESEFPFDAKGLPEAGEGNLS